MLRRNTTAFQAGANGNGPNTLTGNGTLRSTVVACCYCQEPHAVPAQRLGHHARCTKCKAKFYVDQFGNASEPRATQSNQWTPEVKPTAAHATTTEMTLEIPDWALPAGIAAVLVAIGIGLWMWL
jgi:hypothetical protein